MKYEACTTTTNKHPSGGMLSIKRLTDVSCEVVDTRKFAGRRRSVRGVVYQAGSLGWRVVINPGDNAQCTNVQTTTAAGAWEAVCGGNQ